MRQTRPARRLPRLAALAAAAALLGGCSLFEDEERLPGERIPVRQSLPEATGAGAVARPLPAVARNAAWTQSGGGPAHTGGHLAAPAGLSVAWVADAGEGGSDAARITAGPVVGDGRVFALDAAATVTAFDAGDGREIWQASLLPEGEDDGEEGFGGGLALLGDRVYATTGFGEVLSLDAATGEIGWRRRFSAPFRAGPAVANGRLVAVTRDNTAVALDVSDGRVLWRQRGVTGETGWLGGASPLIAGAATVVPFASGELVAFDLPTGRRGWSAVMTGGRRGLARSSITDLTGEPAVVGDRVVVANQSGRLAAFDGRTGRRAWTRRIGATARLWPAGETFFLVSDLSVLTRIDAASGRDLWQRPLPAFEDPEDRGDPILYSGPLLAGGQVLLTDSLGQLHAYDAVSSEGGPVAELPGSSTTGPVAAQGTIFVLTDDAELVALR